MMPIGIRKRIKTNYDAGSKWKLFNKQKRSYSQQLFARKEQEFADTLMIVDSILLTAVNLSKIKN